MTRIAILGNTAGGKSTLARRLARETDLQHVEIDRLYWQPDWTVTPGDIYERRHAEAIAAERWIIEGGGDLTSVRLRCGRATRIILVDLPLRTHLQIAAERQVKWAAGKIEHPPAGIAQAPPTRKLFEIIRTVDREWMPVLRDLCARREAKGVDVVRLRSLEEVSAFGSRARS